MTSIQRPLAAHTPGPWEVITEHEDGTKWVKGIRSANGEWVVRDGWNDDFGHNEFPDARLIAAAPALLDALEAYVAYDIDDLNGDDLHNRAVAAIAAARGEG